MNRTCMFVLVLVPVCSAAYAQTPEDAVRKAENAMVAAAKAGDRAAYQTLYADDLHWLNSDGRMLTKQQRVADVNPSPTFNRDFQTQIRVYGTTAVETGKMVYTDNGQKHTDLVLRVYVNNNGKWQLLSHATVPNAK